MTTPDIAAIIKAADDLIAWRAQDCPVDDPHDTYPDDLWSAVASPEAVRAMADELERLRAQAAPAGCSYCQHPLYAGIKCRSCGRETPSLTVGDAADFTDWGRAAVAWVLWHHQGGSSAIGQPLRFALGLGAHEPLPAHLIGAAKDWAASVGATTDEFHQQKGQPAAQAEPVSAKHAALMLCYELEKQPASSYQTAAVLAAFKVYRAFESIEKHGEIRQWVFDVAPPSNPPAQGIGAASEPGVKEA